MSARWPSRSSRARADADLPERFRADTIELQPPGSSHLLAFYEAGHAFGPLYARGDLPAEDQIREDVEMMLQLYRLASARGGTDDLEVEEEEDEAGSDTGVLEGARRYRYHLTLERSAALARDAKRVHGFSCQCCEFNFEAFFGELGSEYIEAHHLVPLSYLDGDKPVPRSPETDFRVLCSNCHRMIHRMIREVGGPVTVELGTSSKGDLSPDRNSQPRYVKGTESTHTSNPRVSSWGSPRVDGQNPADSARTPRASFLEPGGARC